MRVHPNEAVLVEKSPQGCCRFDMCRGEFDTDGTLIVRVLKTGLEMTRFVPGTWDRARGIDGFGREQWNVTPAAFILANQQRQKVSA
jgi:hypothetical protein